jgi:hypothetical protein
VRRLDHAEGDLEQLERHIRERAAVSRGSKRPEEVMTWQTVMLPRNWMNSRRL